MENCHIVIFMCQDGKNVQNTQSLIIFAPDCLGPLGDNKATYIQNILSKSYE